MKTIRIDVTKIDKARLFKGQKGTYLNLVLFDKPDEHGNAGFVKQEVSKEERERGVEMPILGNWKEFRKNTQPPKPQQRTKPDPDLDGDSEVPF